MSEEVKEEALENKSCCGGETDSGCGCHHDQDVDVADLTDEEEMDLLEEMARLNDQLLRNQAELENFKKRMNDERIKDNKYRSQSLATAILPALDTFERAMAVETENEEVKNFLTGFEMVHKQFIESLASEGIEAIDAEGQPFDPNFHQAVMQEVAEGVEAGIVLAQMQKGYTLKDRVIRPAMVKVSQ
ncbi:MAG: nucleotide exchange factor GrpE [Defluviitaleaceae bacterium]|nr:nucleotide exchange factor GrpE [Defluviitaleaceae bacterium]